MIEIINKNVLTVDQVRMALSAKLQIMAEKFSFRRIDPVTSELENYVNFSFLSKMNTEVKGQINLRFDEAVTVSCKFTPENALFVNILKAGIENEIIKIFT